MQIRDMGQTVVLESLGRSPHNSNRYVHRSSTTAVLRLGDFGFGLIGSPDLLSDATCFTRSFAVEDFGFEDRRTG